MKGSKSRRIARYNCWKIAEKETSQVDLQAVAEEGHADKPSKIKLPMWRDQPSPSLFFNR